MSDDGADLGIGAERALETVLGGKEQPAKEDRLNPQQMMDKLRAAERHPTSYGGSAESLARYMLEFLDAHPDVAIVNLPAEDERDWSVKMPPGQEHQPPLLREGFGGVWKRLDPDGYRTAMDACEPTGFMYGWAYNAVRYVSELGPVSNPAVVTIGG